MKPISHKNDTTATGNRVVISGMAGLYPQSHSVKDLENILYKKINPVSPDTLRWKYNHPEVPQFTGNVPELNFDAQFFKVPYRQAQTMDPMSCKLLELAYAAIYDAGVSPDQLNGKKVGVFIGTSSSEFEKVVIYINAGEYGLTGGNKAMFANRISYWLNTKGPSFNIDQACCSSTVALEQAFQAISRGDCEAAIVGGANLCFHPQTSVHFARILRLAMDGKTRSFDSKASGTALSETINVLYLQKAEDALRIYAEIVHVKCEFSSLANMENTRKAGFRRNAKDHVNFLKGFYAETCISPNHVEYVEAFGTADPETDKTELQAFDEVFCKGRTTPLLVGSVMSNIGYTSAASGISSITKVLLGYNRGRLAGNLHCDTPRNDIAAIREERIHIVNDNQDFQGTYTAVNSLSVTGVNGHALLRGHCVPKDINRYKTDIPHLVTASGRQESAVFKIFKELKSQPIDPELIALMHNIHSTKISGHLARGYIILGNDNAQNTVSVLEEADYYDDTQRPLWFVYSGMGSQWAGMGAEFLQIPIFAAAIERCQRVLEPKGIDIYHIISSTDTSIFDNILHSFVGIAAIQIGLTDVLTEIGLIPDNIIGHSVGELGCAYADGCLTAEQMILSAYSRGLASIETAFIHGAMAAIGAGAKQISKICPPEIDIACHNGPDSCTISGPFKIMRNFIADLTAKGIFAKEVPCSNIAYHSRYIADAGPTLLKYLKDVNITPKSRSKRWISTSFPQDRWEEPIAKYSAAEYYTNNLLSPVLFEEASKLIPSNAVLVEVAPHGLLQAILKRSLPQACTNIPLARRGHQDNILMLLKAVGMLYIKGFNPKIQGLYPKVDFPVSKGTQPLSHFVEWVHEEKWNNTLNYVSANRRLASACEYLISPYDDEYRYLNGCVIKDKTILPFSFALVAAWDTLLMSMQIQKKKRNVMFYDIRFFVQPILYKHCITKLTVSIQKGSGRFEIMNENSRVVTGFIRLLGKKTPENYFNLPHLYEKTLELNSDNVYELFSKREYLYDGEFRSIDSANNAMTDANILWNNNWVTFIDGVLQLNALKQHHNSVSQLDQIGKIYINVTDHIMQTVGEQDGKSVFNACIDDLQLRTRCGGLVIENIKFNHLSQATDNIVTLKKLEFVPRFGSNIDKLSSLQILLQIVAENLNKNEINVIGIKSDNTDTDIFETLKMKCNNIPGIQIQYKELPMNTNISLKNTDLVVAQNILKNENKLQTICQNLKRNAFIINEDTLDVISLIKHSTLYTTVSIMKTRNSRLELARWTPIPVKTIATINIRSKSELSLLDEAYKSLTCQDCLVILTNYPPVKSLKDFVQKKLSEETQKRICVAMAYETESIKKLPNYDLIYNVTNKGIWGGYYYLPLREQINVQEKVTLNIERGSNFNSLEWVYAEKAMEHENLIKVHYASLHISDLKKASRDFSYANTHSCAAGYGTEFSGVTRNGERVMGLVQNNAASNYVVARPELLWPVPSYWTLEDAVTVPFAYVYAYYCLYIKTAVRVVEKDITQFSILVHGGAGALGQAMISIALAKGFRVFATVSDVNKKRFLLRLFPELIGDNIGNSRDPSFGDMIMNATGGKGCNIVVCCLKGELKNISLKCCGPSGTTFDTVTISDKEDYKFGFFDLTYERTYVAVDISSIFTHMKSADLLKIQAWVSDGILLGHVRPLTRVTYLPHEIPRAFRLLARSRQRGRVVLRMQDSESSNQPRFTSVCARCCLIICDAKNMGLDLADILIDSGANKIHIHIPSLSWYLRYKISWWSKLGVEVTVSSECLNSDIDFSNLLQNASISDDLDSIYVIADDSSKNKIISTLDLVTRKTKACLKYFIVLSGDGTSGHETVIQRVRDGLPATLLDISILNNLGSNTTFYREAVKATMLAQNISSEVLIAHPQRLPQVPLLQQIAKLADINVTDDALPSFTLESFGINREKSIAISLLLSSIYHVYFDEEIIPSLTISQLKQIEERTCKPELKENKGIPNIFSYVDPDEIQATNEIAFMPTLANRFSMRADEFYFGETCLYIIPGLEGHHERFRTLCERLKLPAVVLQPGLDYPEETPQELARRYAEILIKKLRIGDTFYLLGYEFGVIVALELASVLESQGKTGIVYCLGDGPQEMKSLLESELSEFKTEEALQTGIAQHMLSLIAGDTKGLDMSVLQDCSSWNERINTCMRMLLGHVSHSSQYTHSLLETAYARITTARQYNAVPRVLRSRLILLRTRQPNHYSDECSLQRYSNNTVCVEYLNAPMKDIAADLYVPSLINRYLGDDILDDYENKNLCDMYLFNPNEYIAVNNN